jgi:hypothetical protein
MVEDVIVVEWTMKLDWTGMDWTVNRILYSMKSDARAVPRKKLEI